jgi:PAS domain S-box-containing protein
MRRGARPVPLAQSLLTVHAEGCSDASLDALAEALAAQCDFSGVLVTLVAGEETGTGQAGSRGALRSLASRPEDFTGSAAMPSWPILDLDSQVVGRLDCALGSDRGPLNEQTLVDLAQVCQHLGVAAGQLVLRQRLTADRQQVAAERRARRQAERELRAVVDESAIGMATVSLDQASPGLFLSVNDALCHLTGRSESELLRLTSSELTHPDDRGIGNSAMRRMAAGRRTPVRDRRRLLCADGSVIWVQVTACPLFDDDEEPLHVVLQIEDVRARQDPETEIAAGHDPLTGLLTGPALEEAMVEVLDRARRQHTTGAVLVCEFDAAEAGTDQEQQLRLAVADTLGRTLRTGDLIARIGENRFAIVAEEVRPENVGSLAGRVAEAMRGQSSLDIGIAVLSPEITDPQVLFARAALAMAQARESGQSYVLYRQPEAELYPSEVLYARPGWQSSAR